MVHKKKKKKKTVKYKLEKWCETALKPITWNTSQIKYPLIKQQQKYTYM